MFSFPASSVGLFSSSRSFTCSQVRACEGGMRIAAARPAPATRTHRCQPQNTQKCSKHQLLRPNSFRLPDSSGRDQLVLSSIIAGPMRISLVSGLPRKDSLKTRDNRRGFIASTHQRYAMTQPERFGELTKEEKGGARPPWKTQGLASGDTHATETQAA